MVVREAEVLNATDLVDKRKQFCDIGWLTWKF